MSCGTITRGAVIDECDELTPGGTRPRIVLINYEDIYKLVEQDGKIIDIVLYAGKKGYEFTGFRNDIDKSEEVVRRETSSSRFIHACRLSIYQVTQEQKNNIENITKGRFVAIVENRGRHDDAIEVLGKECGLEIIGGQIRSAEETEGVFVIDLATPDNDIELELKLPQTLGLSYDDGVSIIEDIINEVTEGVFDGSFDLTFN